MKPYSFNTKRLKQIQTVVTLLDLSYDYCSGGQLWFFLTLYNNNKKLASSSLLHYKKIYPKVEEMVENLMFEQAYSILTTDPVLTKLQQDNKENNILNRQSVANIKRKSLDLYNRELNKI